MGNEAADRLGAGTVESCQKAAASFGGMESVLQDLSGLVAYVCKTDIVSVGLLDEQQRWHELPATGGRISPAAGVAVFAAIAECPDLWIVPDTPYALT